VLEQGLQVVRESAHRDRMVFFATPSFREPVTADFGRRAAAQFEADVKAGATGLKIFKNFGNSVKYADGRRVPVDAPEMDPLWAAAGRLGVPVLIHTGEPAAFWDPIDKFNERWLELTLRPERRMSTAGGMPSFDELMAERDRLFARHAKTTFIVAHMGWHANDLGRLGRLLDRLPNTVVETGAILYDLGRQPHTARAFFLKYQDRILFGKDAYAANEYPYYWRTFETRDEYFDYYRKYHAFWKLYGLDLPDEVLKKLYYANALRVVPGILKNAFPS
jgi:predicted TIM-barrel fold metal-dependent hydrolase